MKSVITRKVVKNGDSLTVALPKDFLKTNSIDKSSSVTLFFDDQNNSITVTYDKKRDVLNKLTKAAKIIGLKKLVLFGSYARGDFDENSDVDVFYEYDGDLKSFEIKKLIDKYVGIDVHIQDIKSLNRLIDDYDNLDSSDKIFVSNVLKNIENIPL